MFLTANFARSSRAVALAPLPPSFACIVGRRQYRACGCRSGGGLRGELSPRFLSTAVATSPNFFYYQSSPSQRRPSLFHNTISTKRLIFTRKMASATSFYDFKPLDKKGQEQPTADYKGKVVLIVNTASKCGFTPQYEGLEALYQKLHAKYGDDVVFLGFPCNQFGGQEPGTDDEIQNFCQINYGVSFPIMGKIDVNGGNAAPIYEWLKNEKAGLLGLKLIKWNFEKFLVGRDGKVKNRWASTTKPDALEKPIVDELEQKAETPANL